MAVGTRRFTCFLADPLIRSATRYSPHYTIDDYRLWEGDWELWQGTAVAMTPSLFGRHGGMLVRLGTALTILRLTDQGEYESVPVTDEIILTIGDAREILVDMRLLRQ